MNKKYLVALVATTLITACASGEVTQDYPKSRDDVMDERVGKLSGDEGLVIFGGKKSSAAIEGINVNSYLWRASLDKIHKMPLISADPFGGTILTDWYSLTSDERYKLNIYIIGGELRSDALKISVFKQRRSGSGWVDVKVSEELIADFENSILLKARQIKFSTAE